MLFKNYWKSIAWFSIIILLSVISSNKLPEVSLSFKFTDKIVHFVMYFIFSYLIMEGHEQHVVSTRKYHILVAFLIPLAVGVFTELLQELITLTREGDPWDFVANAFGVIMGIILFSRIYPLQNRVINQLKKIAKG